MPKTIKESNLHEIVTIRKILEDLQFETNLLTVDHSIEKNLRAVVDDALAEIRQLLKEAEPEHKPLSKYAPSDRWVGYEQALDEYTANIEKRLG